MDKEKIKSDPKFLAVREMIAEVVAEILAKDKKEEEGRRKVREDEEAKKRDEEFSFFELFGR